MSQVDIVIPASATRRTLVLLNELKKKKNSIYYKCIKKIYNYLFSLWFVPTCTSERGPSCSVLPKADCCSPCVRGRLLLPASCCSSTPSVKQLCMSLKHAKRNIWTTHRRWEAFLKDCIQRNNYLKKKKDISTCFSFQRCNFWYLNTGQWKTLIVWKILSGWIYSANL